MNEYVLSTTFKDLREYGACKAGYQKLAKNLGGIRKYGSNTPIPLSSIWESNGWTDLGWTMDQLWSDPDSNAETFFDDWSVALCESILMPFLKSRYKENMLEKLENYYTRFKTDLRHRRNHQTYSDFEYLRTFDSGWLHYCPDQCVKTVWYMFTSMYSDLMLIKALEAAASILLSTNDCINDEENQEKLGLELLKQLEKGEKICSPSFEAL